MAKLSTYVTVHRSEDGTSHTFGPADDLPSWAEKAITNPDVWDGDPPAHVAGGDEGGSTPPEDSGEPPRSGPGSSRDAWAKYARALGVDVTDEMKQSDIIAAVDAHKADRQ
jgi:hypothetical protein